MLYPTQPAQHFCSYITRGVRKGAGRPTIGPWPTVGRLLASS